MKRIVVSIGSSILALTAAFSAQGQTYSNAVQALNPAAYWPLTESTAPSGGLYVATNSGTAGAAGNGYYETWWQTNASGVLTNGNSIVHVTGAIPGDSDTAMQQGAIGQYVVIPRTTNGVINSAVTLTPPFSIEAWIYPTNGTLNQLKPIIAEGFNNVQATNLNYITTTEGVGLGLYSTNLYFVTYNGAGTKSEIDANAIALNTWHHFVATFDGTTKKLYLDGNLIGSQTPPLDAFGKRFAPDMVSPLMVGGGNELGISGGANVPFGGAIDEVAFYNTALTQTQVTNHFWVGTNTSRTTSYSQTVSSDSPTIYLRLDEPAFTGPTLTSLPVANNYGSLGASANGYYLPGATPGVAGSGYAGFGPFSGSVALNGFNSGVDVGGGTLPAQLNPNNRQPMTVTAWFRGNPSDCVGRFQEIVGHSDSGWRLALDNTAAGNRFNPGNGPELLFGGVNDVLANGMFVNDGNWHFVAGVSDGTNDFMYVDGVLVKSGTNEGVVTNGSALDVILGGDPQYLAPQPATSVAGGGRWFDGSIAQVAFFTNALTGSQIGSIYSAAGVPPSIRIQPVSRAVFKGANVSIPAFAVGSAPLSYQWYSGSTPVGGQTASALAFSPVTAGSAGSYYLVVNNSFGAATSAVIQVTVSANTATPYNAAIEQLSPAAYWPLNETNQPPFGQYIATNLGTLGTSANAYYQSFYQPISVGVSNTFYATNNIQHGPGATGDGDTGMLCGQATGAGQYVVLPRATNGVANAATAITAPFTIEAWVMTTNLTSGVRPIVNQGRVSDQNPSIGAYGNLFYGFSLGQYQSYFYFQIYNGTANANAGPELDMHNLQPNIWYHVAVTYDGTTETLYSNGVYVTSAASSFVPDPVAPLMIGSGTEPSQGSGAIEFGGAIDDVAIYNVALTQSQIQAHYSAVGSGYTNVILGDHPTIYYRLDEPAFNSYPSPGTYPVAANYGTVGAAANGAYQPGATPGVAGPSFAGLGSNAAVAFNGFYGAVDIGGGMTPAALNPTGNAPQTVVAWFQANPADARFQEIVSRGDSSWRLAFNGNNAAGSGSSTAPFDNHFNPGNNPELQFTNITDVTNNHFFCNDGNWHMVAGVSDGANAYMYIDGNLAKTTNGVGALAGSALDAMIGGSPAHTTPSYNSANIRYFDGQIAQVSYFTNALSAAQIQSLYVVAGVPLSIVQQPQSATFDAGSNATLTVIVHGSSPIYQWYSTNVNNGQVTKVTGQTNATLSLNPVNLAEAGYYFVVATNAEGAVTSSVAQLTIVGPPQMVNSSPNTLHVFVETTPTLNMSVIAPSPVYQWYSNGVAIAGATNSSFVTNSAYTLSTNNTSSTGTFTYTCVATNAFGSATDTFTVTVLADPTAPYPVAVLADKPLYYYRLDEPDTGYPNDGVVAYDYAGGENGTYSNTDLSQPGYSSALEPTEMSALFANSASLGSYMGNTSSYLDLSTSSNAEFTVEAWVNATYKPNYDAGLVTIGYGYGGEQFCLDCGAHDPDHDVRFYVNAVNGTTYSVLSTFALYNNQGWHHVVGVCDEAGGQVSLYIDGILVGSTFIPATAGIRSETAPLAIGSRLYNNNDTLYTNQFYGYMDDVAIYNHALTQAQVQSHYAGAGVGPVITQVSPVGSTNTPGTTATFTVSAFGTQPLTYQWYDNNNNPIPYGTNATLTLTNLQTSQSGQYNVAVANLYNTATTNVTLAVVGGPATITTDLTPTNIVTFASTMETYTIVAGGDTPLFYQWYKDGSIIPNATNSSYTFAALLGTNTYYCVVSNAESAPPSGPGPVTSATGTVAGMPSTTLNPANYTDRMKIVFSGYNRGEVLSNFPVLVELNTGITGFSYAHFASAIGGDLRFTDSGGTRVIPSEIDEWNANGTSIVWVQMPMLTGTNDYIWAYWGNPADTTPLSGTNVWVPPAWQGTAPYAAVYHLKENGFPYVDSTSQYTSTSGGTAPTQATGIIGTGESFAGASYLDDGTVNLSNAFTMSAWVNVNPSATSIQTVWANKPGGYSSDGFDLYVNAWQSNPGDGSLHMETGNGTAGQDIHTGPGAVQAGWHYLTAVVNPAAGQASLYVDAQPVASGGIRQDLGTNNDMRLGIHLDNSYAYNGLMDEARIRLATNSPNWIWAEYMSVANNATFQTYSNVTSTIASGPVTILFQKAGANLIMTGGGGSAGAEYRVVSSTNIALPMAQWTTVTTTNFDGSGNFSNAVPIDSTNKSLFFRIAVP